MYTNERLYEMHLKELRQEVAYNQLVREAESGRKHRTLTISSIFGNLGKRLIGMGSRAQGALVGKNEATPLQIIRLEKSPRAG